MDEFLKHIEESNKSNLIFHKINYLRIQYFKGKKTRAGSYIETPKTLKAKNGIVNNRNKFDDMCIIWCLLANKYDNTIIHNKNQRHQHIKSILMKLYNQKILNTQ